MTRATVCAVLLAVFLLAAVAGPAGAQDAPAPARVWLGVGPGFGAGPEIVGGLGGLIQLTWQRERTHLALRTLGLVDFDGFPDSGGGSSATELGLLYGRARVTSWGHAAVGAGLSGVYLEGCGDDGPDECWAVGVPLAAEAALQALVAGLGVQAFANLNTRAPYGGLVLFLQLGWMP